jgi:hypothetical protein
VQKEKQIQKRWRTRNKSKIPQALCADACLTVSKAEQRRRRMVALSLEEEEESGLVESKI